jgi:glycosyltransferase involved in cell wall biosynthesis
MPLTIAIDASNIRAGGGISHLCNVLRAVELRQTGFQRIFVFGVAQTLRRLEPRDWLIQIPVDYIHASPLHRAYWQLVGLPALLRGMRVDVLFSPGGLLPFHCPCSSVVMSRNMLPFVSAERARYGLSGMRLKLELLRIMQSWSFERATGVIYLTDYARRTIGNQLSRPPSRSAVIPHGIGDRFRNRPRPQRPLDTYSLTEPFRFLYVSILAPYKHQWRVAAAIDMLRREGLPVAIDFVGPKVSEGYRKLEPFLRSGEGYITYRGNASYTEMSRIYQEADAFAYASTCENLPNILIEAMAGGLPIASSDREPMTSVLGDGGVYFNSEDALSIAAALKSLATDAPLRQTLAERAYRRASELTWERCASETLRFISETV